MTGLKERRKALGLSQFELAKKVAVSVVSIQLWERGVGLPNQDNAERLETVLYELEKEQLKKLQDLTQDHERKKPQE